MSKSRKSKPRGIKGVTHATAVGQRDYQEDRYVMISADEGVILAVMDGHGGESVSALLDENFREVWKTVFAPEKLIEQVYKELFEKFDTLTCGMHPGSTMSVAFIPASKDKVHVAILGDSPILVQKPDGTFHMSPEHNVRTNWIERDRAIQRGGWYSANGYICGPEGHGLQMSRAFGDTDLGFFLSREPEVYSVELGDWVLVATDGLVSPGHDESAAAVLTEVVRMVEEADVNAEELVNYAVKIPTGDNVTALLWRRS
jgi:serine/threonine protein phosphatase PrpC